VRRAGGGKLFSILAAAIGKLAVCLRQPLGVGGGGVHVCYVPLQLGVVAAEGMWQLPDMGWDLLLWWAKSIYALKPHNSVHFVANSSPPNGLHAWPKEAKRVTAAVEQQVSVLIGQICWLEEVNALQAAA